MEKKIELVNQNEDEKTEIASTRELSLKSETSKAVKWENVILTIALLVIYACTLGYGISQLINPVLTTSSQALLIVLQCTGGLVLSIAPDLIERWFHIKMSFAVRFAIELFGIMGIVLGEGFQFYYKLSNWDDMLHLTSGFGVAFLGCAVVANINKKSLSRHKTLIAITLGVLISFSIGFLWELMEYSMDVFFKTNMQKCMPEIADLFNGGNTGANLNGTDEEIAAFFRTPEGYRYALTDTMSDLIDCFSGSMVFVLVGSLISWKHPNAFENLIEFNSKKSVKSN